jgi:hypothetical protein
MVSIISALWFALVCSVSIGPLVSSPECLGPVDYKPLDVARCEPNNSCLMWAPFPGRDDTLVSQPFVYEYVWNTWPCYSGIDYMLAEDCYPVTGYQITDVYVWMVFSSGIPVTQYNLGLQCDSDGPDGSFIWLSSETDISNTVTGYSGWGYEFWCSHISIADPPTLYAGSTYWFCLQAESTTGVYWLFRNNQPAWGELAMMSEDNGISWSIPTWEFGTFLVIQGTTTSLERQTWGEIKAVCW